MTHEQYFAMAVDECRHEATAEPEQVNQQKTQQTSRGKQSLKSHIEQTENNARHGRSMAEPLVTQRYRQNSRKFSNNYTHH